MSNTNRSSGESGCRPCCSLPHGSYSVLTCVMATVAWGLSFLAVTNCHYLKPNYLYCHPPPPVKPKFGSCGDCHCINGDQPCPSDPGEIPLTQVPNDWLGQLKAMDAINPIGMTCNPYNTSNYLNCTSPPLVEYQIDLWETAVCGHLYDMESLDDNQCPTQYKLQTFDSRTEMEQAGAVMTHWGACGACSTSKDLAVYLEYPDLTGKGQECSIRGLGAFGGKFEEGIACFQEVGYTYSCAEMWMYNVLNTRDNCFDVCVDFTFFSDGANNGPPPECKIADCLLCDEQMSGPFFQTVAARSRRRSGLLSKIVRTCEVILIVDHEPPCTVTQRQQQQQQQASSAGGVNILSIETNITNNNNNDDGGGGQRERRELQVRSLQSDQRITAPPKFVAPPKTDTCVYITTELGLTSHEMEVSNNWLNIPEWLLLPADREEISKYDSCRAYDFNGVLSGFWRNQKEIFGSAFNAANTFGSLALLLGIIHVVCVWVTTCVDASGTKFWSWCMAMFGICGCFMLLTLVFFASRVCENGCEIGSAAITAIVAGIIWWITAGLCHLSKPAKDDIPHANCCCCPTVVKSSSSSSSSSTQQHYKMIPADAADNNDDEDVVEVEVLKSKKENGDIVVSKITKYPNGKKLVERTTYKGNSSEDDDEEVAPTISEGIEVHNTVEGGE